MTDFTVIIPARYASSRLPGKPLADIAGQTMIERVVDCAKKSSAKRIVVATDDQRIVDALSKSAIDVVMTREDHQSGTDRLQEVVAQLGLGDNDIVVNVQGDEPLIPAAVIDQVAKNLAENESVSASTLCEPVESVAHFLDENVVKVTANNQGEALYFSRAPIPWVRGQMNTLRAVPAMASRHIGIYGYRVSLLNQFVHWPLGELENLEKLEQLRILENGHRIHIEAACENVPAGVDTEQDLQQVRAYFKS